MECSRVADLARSGDHKPAADAFRELEMSGKSCPPDIQEEVSLSRSKLNKADSHVHKALRMRKEGKLLSARAELQQALETYPRYYWVQTLIKNVDRSIQAELDSLKHEAVYFESRGEPENALSRIEDAMSLAPGDRDLESEAARLREVIATYGAQGNIQVLLDEVRAHLENNRFEEARRVLAENNAAGRLGARGEEMLAEVRQRRREHVRLRLEDAVDKEKSGDLTAAEGHTLYILEMSVPGDPLSERIVEFARLLGMKLYSAGELSRAKELWTRALRIDPGNIKLQGYLEEVETRLDKLDRIKRGGDGSVGK